MPPHQLVTDHTVLSVVVGSRAYGLADSDSDFDRRGVYAAPTSSWWGFDKPPTHVDGPDPERFSWELERFLGLALAANPTVLECLWSPIVEHCDTIGEELRALRGRLVSREVYRTFLGYANSQVDRLSTAMTARDWKQTMHMLRLLISARHFLATGEPLVNVAAYRDKLLAVRHGEVPWATVQRWRDELAAAAEAARSATRLPARPDRAAAERLLIEVRRIRL
ncbi:nucleotidyltransferase domain-containing protein [Stackebrandtia albiflava]|uniref:nucleotidyltransferase domain-containing protein n=1 Tax=Stackebrandtia albiflava TaxID=406432 RepID=UPI003CC8097C